MVKAWSDIKFQAVSGLKNPLKAIGNTVIFDRLSPNGQWTDSQVIFYLGESETSRISPVALCQSADAVNSMFFIVAGQQNYPRRSTALPLPIVLITINKGAGRILQLPAARVRANSVSAQSVSLPTV